MLSIYRNLGKTLSPLFFPNSSNTLSKLPPLVSLPCTFSCSYPSSISSSHLRPLAFQHHDVEIGHRKPSRSKLHPSIRSESVQDDDDAVDSFDDDDNVDVDEDQFEHSHMHSSHRSVAPPSPSSSHRHDDDTFLSNVEPFGYDFDDEDDDLSTPELLNHPLNTLSKSSLSSSSSSSSSSTSSSSSSLTSSSSSSSSSSSLSDTIHALKNPESADPQLRDPRVLRILALHAQLESCKETGDGPRAETLFKEVVALEQPTFYNHGILAETWARALNPAQVRDVIRRAQRHGVVDRVMYSALIHTYFRLKRPREAWEAFEECRRQSEALQPDEVMYTIMISVCALEGRAERAFNLLDEMLQDGLMPTEATYNSLIQACASRRDYYDEVFRTVARMKSAGYSPDEWTYGHMLTAAAAVGDVQGVKRLLASFERLLEKSARVLRPDQFAYLFRALAYNTRKARADDIKALVGAADDLWLELHSHPGWQPSALLYNAYLKVFTESLRVKRAETIFASFREGRIEADQTSYAYMIDMYMRFKKTTEAEDLYRRMLDCGIASNAEIYRLMINGFAKANYFRSALRYLHDMGKVSRLRPQPRHTLLLAKKTQDYPHVRTVLGLILKDHGIVGPEADQYFRAQARPSKLFSKQKGGEAAAVRMAVQAHGKKLGMGIEDTNDQEPSIFRYNRHRSDKPVKKRFGKTKSFKK